MTWSTAFLLACTLLPRPSKSTADPIVYGGNYLITSEDANTFLRCSTSDCVMEPMSDALESDGWSDVSNQGYVQFIGNNGAFALDCDDVETTFSAQTGYNVYGNTDMTVSVSGDHHEGQLWSLGALEDGSYQILNLNFLNYALDIDSGVTPFVNSDDSPSSLSGQHWFFWSVYPQFTTTTIATTVVTVNTLAASTVVVTTTICPQKRAHVNGTPLHKRQNTGTDLTSTTTVVETNYVTSTTTQTGNTILTSTDVVTSCAAVTETQTQTQVSVSKTVATATVASPSTAGGGTGLTAGAPGITETNTQPSNTPATTSKSGAMGAWKVDTVLGLVFLGMAVLVPGVVF